MFVMYFDRVYSVLLAYPHGVLSPADVTPLLLSCLVFGMARFKVA